MITKFSLSILLFAYASARFCKIGKKCDECEVEHFEGKSCNSENSKKFGLIHCLNKTNFIVPDEHVYLKCDNVARTLQINHCPMVNGISLHFEHGKCTDHVVRRYKRVIGTARVGEACIYNTDCLQPDMYCSAGLCDCTSSAVARDNFCYRKVNPGESGCQYLEQCLSVWPGTTCSTTGGSLGTCTCPTNYAPARTRDGTVCMQTTGSGGTAITTPAASCPLPEISMTSADRNNMRGMINNLPMTCNPAGTNTGTTFGTDCAQITGVAEGEIMDCIGPIGATGTNLGVCCPNKALTCILPMLTGSGTGTSYQRFWYNSVTGTCQQFTWTSTSPTWANTNSNNFGSLEHCESYCKDTCPRGNPTFTTTTSQATALQVTCDTSTTSCATNYACTTVGSFEYCCPESTYICSTLGGRAQTSSTTPNAGWQPTAAATITTRYYYNAATGACTSFQYNGLGGNFNMFGSATDCSNYCASQLCTNGNPLKLTNGQNKRCSTDSDCPTTYRCTSSNTGGVSVCCPLAQQVCSQNKQVGTCTQYVSRYWHNPTTRTCELFQYSGCQGNDNNFDTVLACQTFCRSTTSEPQCIQGTAYKDSYGAFWKCSGTGVGGSGVSVCPANFECYFDGYMWGCCPSKAYTCSLSSSVGRQCGPIVSRWYYDATNQRCDALSFLGCDGNSNNFVSRDLCEGFCGVGGCPNGGTAYKEPSSGITRVCSGAITCLSGYECDTVNVGGTAINYCCPTRAHICSQPPTQGSTCGNTNVQRYYFNPASRTCTTFTYQGCTTNGNNFATLAQCNNYCSSAGCTAGEVVLLNPNTQTSVTCNQQIANSCPTGYTCRLDTLTSQSICCGATSQGVCPTNEKAFIDAMTMAVRECLPNVVGTCTNGYQCRFNSGRNKYYCCASVTGQLCPSGKAVYKEPVTRNNRQCNLGQVFNTCPNGYSCQSAVSNAFQGFCCTNNAVCPNNVVFDKDSSGNPLLCTIGSTVITCRSGYACMTNNVGTTTGYCCKGTGGTVQGGCPVNQYVYMVNNQVVSCNPFNNPTGCPTTGGYSCQWSSVNSRYQCCTATPTTTVIPPTAVDGCPNSQIAYKPNNVVQSCTTNSNTCPTGYFCQYSTTNNRYQCCGVNGGCPNNQVAYISVSGQPQTCVINQVGGCINMFTCQMATTGAAICCTSGGTTRTCLPTQILFNGQCLNQVNVGQSCQVTNQCLGGSTCIGGVCQIGGTTCTANQILVNGVCLNRVNPGQACTNTLQCLSSSLCTNGICNCPTGFRIQGTQCVSTQTSQATVPTSVTTVVPPTADTNCRTGQVMIQNRCFDRVPPGQRCLDSSMCSGGASCNRMVCTCPAGLSNINGVCTTGGGGTTATATCPIVGQSPYIDPTTRSARFCNTNTPGSCPVNYNCQYSSTARQNICCGSPAISTNVCNTGRSPLLDNGSPRVCTGNTFSCPSGYSCQFSMSQRQYFCCTGSVASVGPAPSAGTNGCPRGNAMIYPPTGTPVVCQMNPNNCPQGYTCQFSATNNQNQCCSAIAARRRRNFNTGIQKSPCKSNQVLVIKLSVDGKAISRCEHNCPSHQISKKGICVDLNDGKKNDPKSGER